MKIIKKGLHVFLSLLEWTIIITGILAGIFMCYSMWWHKDALPRWEWFEEKVYAGEEPPYYPTLNLVPESQSHAVSKMWFTGIRECDGEETATELSLSDYDDYLHIEPDHVYEIRIDCFNAGDPEGNESGETIAHDVKLSVDLSKVKCATTQEKLFTEAYVYDVISVTLASSNASPGAIHDQVAVIAKEDLSLKLIGATLHTNGGLGGIRLPDEVIMPRGTLLGYDQLDGKIPAGKEFACYVTLRFRTVASPWNLIDTLWLKTQP